MAKMVERVKRAFPCNSGAIEQGMDLRDYFAAQALIAISGRWGGTLGDIDKSAADRSAQISYQLADAMMRARQLSSQKCEADRG
jgi:hypothetical protein